jgi:hypothetical protein
LIFCGIGLREQRINLCQRLRQYTEAKSNDPPGMAKGVHRPEKQRKDGREGTSAQKEAGLA